MMWLIDLVTRGGRKPMATQQPQTPAPQFLSDVGDLTWVMGMIDWLVSRQIIPDWVAALLKFTLNMFVPGVRSRSDSKRSLDDLHHSWDEFVATHPMAAPYAQAARSAPGTPLKE